MDRYCSKANFSDFKVPSSLNHSQNTQGLALFKIRYSLKNFHKEKKNVGNKAMDVDVELLNAMARCGNPSCRPRREAMTCPKGCQAAAGIPSRFSNEIL